MMTNRKLYLLASVTLILFITSCQYPSIWILTERGCKIEDTNTYLESEPQTAPLPFVFRPISTQSISQNNVATIERLVSVQLNDTVNDLAFTRAADSLMIALDNSVQRWNLSAGTATNLALKPQPNVRYPDTVYRIAVNAEDGQIAMAIGSTIELRTQDRQFACIARDATDGITEMHYTPNGKVLLASSYDQHIRGYDTKTGKLIYRWTTPSLADDITISPDGDLLVSSSADKNAYTISLLSLTSKKQIQRFPLGKFSPRLSFAPQSNNTILATASYDINIIDVHEGRILRTFAKDIDTINELEFTSDATLLVSGSNDQTVRFWDWQQGREVHRLLLSSEVISFALSPDNTLLAVATKNGEVELWGLPEN